MHDYARLCKALRHCATHFSCSGCGGDCKTGSNEPRTKAVLNDAADAIEELLARDVVPTGFHERCLKIEIEKRFELEKQVSHWISVEDELPDDFSRVLGFMAWGGMMLLERQSKGWYLADRIQQAPDEAVLYWMPLPKAPKEVE